jgi:hypothetical protein
MRHLLKATMRTTVIGMFGLIGLSGVVMAQDTCDPKKPECACDPKKQECPPPPKTQLCHNIGGPRDLGANCDGTGNCSMTFTNDLGQTQTLNVPENWFLGIIISAGPSALNAHLKHGDGFAEVTFSPALHLASTGQNHEASNVECFAERATTTQPPEPGN